MLTRQDLNSVSYTLGELGRLAVHCFTYLLTYLLIGQESFESTLTSLHIPFCDRP
jgi:hypothetical protein